MPAPVHKGRSSWFFVNSTGPRARRPVDVLIIVGGLLLTGLTARRADQLSGLERGVVDALARAPGWVVNLGVVTYALGGLYALAIVFAVIFRARRNRLLARDLAVAVVAALVLVAAAALLVENHWPELLPELMQDDPVRRFPATRVAVVTAVLLTVRPYVARPFRRLSGAIIAVLALAACAAGISGPSDVLGALGLGLIAGAAALVAFGSPGGHPNLDEVSGALSELGIVAGDLRFADRQTWGVRVLHAEDPSGRPLLVKVYGRDAADAQFFARGWRSLIYRDAGPPLRGTRLQLVEHEALVTVLAQRAGVPTTDVVAAARTQRDDALLVLTRPQGSMTETPAERLTDTALVSSWAAVARLHAAGISHGRLTLDWLSRDGDSEKVVFSGFEYGTLAAPYAARASDVANLLSSQAFRVGVSRAVSAALTGLGPDQLTQAFPYLQPAALTASFRWPGDSKSLLGRLRTELAERTGTEPPPQAQVHRVTLKDIVTTALTLLAGYALITAFAQLDWGTILQSWADAAWAWVLPAAAFASATVLSDAVSTMSVASRPLPLGPVAMLQYAGKFVGLAIPGPAGRLATTSSFLRRFGMQPAEAVTQSALDSAAGMIVEGSILVIAVVFADVSFGAASTSNAGDIGDGGTSGFTWLLIVAVLVAVAAIAVIPKLRNWVTNAAHQAWNSLAIVMRSPVRAFLLLGSNLLSRVLYALALGCVVKSLHESLNLGTLLVVIVAASLLGSVVPVPGNVGVAEAALAGGLIWAGLPEATAFAAAVTYRILSAYLPPVIGAFAIKWLEKRDYLA